MRRHGYIQPPGRTRTGLVGASGQRVQRGLDQWSRICRPVDADRLDRFARGIGGRRAGKAQCVDVGGQRLHERSEVCREGFLGSGLCRDERIRLGIELRSGRRRINAGIGERPEGVERFVQGLRVDPEVGLQFDLRGEPVMVNAAIDRIGEEAPIPRFDA